MKKVEVKELSDISIYNSGDDRIEQIKSILNNKIIKFSDNEIILYDNEYSLTFYEYDKKSTYYFNVYKDDDVINQSVTVIVLDYTEGMDTSVTLDYPYYLITTISLDEFKTIFPTFSETKCFE